jgi:peroxiredoxin
MSVSFFLSYGVLWLLVAFQGLVLIGLARSIYRLQPRIDGSLIASSNGPLRGEEAPHFNARDIRGSEIRSEEFVGRRTALLFVSPSCRSCTATLEEIDALAWKADGHVLAVCRGDRHGCHELVERYELDLPFIVDDDYRISEAFGISAVPTAVLIDEDNRIEAYGNPSRDGAIVGQAVEPEREPAEQEVFH